VRPFTLGAGELLLDQPTEADVDAIAGYCQDPVFERFLTLPWPYERKDAEFFVNEYVPHGWETGTEVTWALRRDEVLLGVVGVRASRSMVGFWLGAPHRGRGYMPLAVSAVADWAFANRWLDRIRWEAVVGNAASLAVARKAGFRYTGIEPANVVGRDGSRPDSWQAVLHAEDDRAPKPGWPDA
jgi:RimJ/RimL family protein N-acetyltransferase